MDVAESGGIVQGLQIHGLQLPSALMVLQGSLLRDSSYSQVEL